MKIELKHLVYQNHKPLNVVFSDTNEVDIITQIDFENGIVSFLNRKENYLLSSGIFKLVIRPLSDLTKEEFNYLHTLLRVHVGKNKRDKLINECYGITDLPYFIFEQLLENHFDIFGLIEKGLAVDINNC